MKKGFAVRRKKLNDTIKSGERARRHVVGEGGTRKKPNKMDKTGREGEEKK